MRLKDKVALITGSSRNIGRAIALGFAREGANVVLNSLQSPAELESVAFECSKLGGQALPIVADVSDPAAVQSMVDKAIARFGKIDILVSNAAIRPREPITSMTIEEWHRVMGINLHATFYLCKAVVPHMIRRQQGSIIAIGGPVALQGTLNNAHRAAAKAGVAGLIRALAAELGEYGIRANMVHPGRIDTEEDPPSPLPSPEELAKVPLRRIGRREEVAAACVFLASEESSFTTGDRILCTGGTIMG